MLISLVQNTTISLNTIALALRMAGIKKNVYLSVEFEWKNPINQFYGD